MELAIFICCFLVICVVWFLIITLCRIRDEKQISFDERQLIARNRAYKYAFFVLMVYFAVMEIIDITGLLDLYWSPESNLGVGMFLSVGTFAVISIFQDAYIPAVNGKIRNSFIIFAILGISQLCFGISNAIENGGIIGDGRILIPISLSIGLLFTVLCAALLIKLAIDKKSAKDED